MALDDNLPSYSITKFSFRAIRFDRNENKTLVIVGITG